MSVETTSSLVSIAREMEISQLGSGRAFLVEIRNKAAGYFGGGQISVPVQWSYGGQTGAVRVVMTPEEMLNVAVAAINQLDSGDTGEATVSVSFPVFAAQH